LLLSRSDCEPPGQNTEFGPQASWATALRSLDRRNERTNGSLLLIANSLQFAGWQRKPVSPGRDSADREFGYVSGSPRGISWSFPIPIHLIRGRESYFRVGTRRAGSEYQASGKPVLYRAWQSCSNGLRYGGSLKHWAERGPSQLGAGNSGRAINGIGE